VTNSVTRLNIVYIALSVIAVMWQSMTDRVRLLQGLCSIVQKIHVSFSMPWPAEPESDL
jgi:hypothetical protein